MENLDNISHAAEFKGASSSVAIYLYSNALTQEESQAIIGNEGGRITNPNADYKWRWDGKRNDYDDPAQSLRDFLVNDFQSIKDGVMKVCNGYNGEAELHLVVGIARVLKTEEWPDIHIDIATLRQLSQSGLELLIFFEQQMR
jgi:hypothetical protein